MSRANLLELIACRLMDDWDDDQYSLKPAFAPVGQPKPGTGANTSFTLVDELRETNSATVFYAARTSVPGSADSDLRLLPFRLEVADFEPPPAPRAWWVPGPDGAVLRWDTNADVACDGYEIRRGPGQPRSIPLAGMTQI